MIGYFLLIVMSFSLVPAIKHDYRILDTTFQLHPGQRRQVTTLQACNGVNGTTSGCAECYLCTDPTILYYKNNGTKINTFMLKDNKCQTTTVCCISQYDFLYRERSSSECGKANPNGYPRSRKPSPRANMPGEYPWRAWIYKKMNPVNAICSATYIHTRVLVTLASCVNDFAAEELSVTFVRGSDSLFDVSSVIIHAEYVTGRHIHDIAIVSFSQFSRAPRWVRVSCYPASPPVHAAACQTVSKDDKTINAVIPLRKTCSKDDSDLHISQICAVSPRGDFAPEKGAGLYCVQHYGNQPAYVFYGMAQETDGNSLSLYTNVSHYRVWLETTLGISLF